MQNYNQNQQNHRTLFAKGDVSEMDNSINPQRGEDF